LPYWFALLVPTKLQTVRFSTVTPLAWSTTIPSRPLSSTPCARWTTGPKFWKREAGSHGEGTPGFVPSTITALRFTPSMTIPGVLTRMPTLEPGLSW